MKLAKYIKDVSEEDYREIPAFNYSILKAMSENGPRVLVEKEELSSTALEFGTLVDILITNPEERYNKFYTKTVEKPTASLLQLADAIYMDHLIMDIPFESINVEMVVKKVRELGLWAKQKDETIIEKFNIDLFYNYIKAKIEAEGKIICTQELVDAAEYCARVLLTHDYTKDLFVESDTVEVLKQVPILYNFKGYMGKGKIDLLRIDHEKKIIYPYDIKTGSEVASNFANSFYHFKYYIQATSYMYGLSYLIENIEEFKDYKIDNFRFIYISKKSPDFPAIYVVPESCLVSFFDGWTSLKGEYIKGFKDLVEEYIFYKSNDIYNVEKKIIDNNGVLNISLQ